MSPQGERQNWEWVWSILAPRNGRCHHVVSIADTITVSFGSIQPVWLFESPDGKVRNRFFEKDHRNGQGNHGRSTKNQVQKPPLTIRQLVGEINTACGDSGCIVRLRSNEGAVVCEEVLSDDVEWGVRQWSNIESGVQKAVAIQLLPLSQAPKLQKVKNSHEVEVVVDSCMLPSFVCKYQQTPPNDIEGEEQLGVGAATCEVMRKPLPKSDIDSPPNLPSAGLVRSTATSVNQALELMTRRIVSAVQSRGGCMVLDARAEFLWRGKPIFVGFDHVMTTEPKRSIPPKGACRYDFAQKVLNAHSVQLDGSVGELKASQSAPQIGLLPKRPTHQKHEGKGGIKHMPRYMTQMPEKFVAEVTLPPWRISKTMTDSAMQPGSVASEKHCYGDCCKAYVRYPGRLRDLESSQTPWMSKARELCRMEPQSLGVSNLRSQSHGASDLRRSFSRGSHSHQSQHASKLTLFSFEEMALCMQGEEDEAYGSAKASAHASKGKEAASGAKKKESTTAITSGGSRAKSKESIKSKESGPGHHGYVLGSWLVEARAYPTLALWLEEVNWMMDANDTEQVLLAEKCFRQDEEALREDGRGDILEALQGTKFANGPGFVWINQSFPVCPICLQAHTAIHEAVTLIRVRKRQVWAHRELRQRRQMEEETRRQDFVGWLERMYRARDERQPRPASAGAALPQFEVRSRSCKFSQSVTPCEELKVWLRGSSSEAWALRNKTFTTKGRFGDHHTWEWWSKSKCEQAGILAMQDQSVEVLQNSKRLASVLSRSIQVKQPWTPSNLEEVLRKYDVDPSRFVAQSSPPARTLQQFAHELQVADCYFRVRDAVLIRVVDHVIMRLHAGEKPVRFIVEQKQDLKERGLEKGFALPQAIRRPYEDVISTAQRVIDKEMGLPPSMFKFIVSHFEHLKEEEEADADLYPGLASVHLKHYVDASLISTDPAQLALVGVPGYKDFTIENVFKAGRDGAQERLLKFYTWMQESACVASGLQTRGLHEKSDIESSCTPLPAPWTGEALSEVFFTKGIDASAYGKGEAKTLEKFSHELSTGRSYLMSFDRVIIRIVEVIDLHVHSLDGNLLVETLRVSPDGVHRIRNLFPGLKRETSATWAIRETVLLILQDMNFHSGSLDMELGDEILLEKDSKVYPAVKSIFRKQIIHLYMKAT
eukprot:gnl/MRDRNA2_/MRDRNA2_102013_c0_seq1.p1 gnl/MRDRNA2_/MRDRNA2_102013_c0~~gnl/MRDRNA2_/MRDRNA2_102013_c0_seq1.p1  ORF type:complete len:1164 (+),score=201.93 gnl/MRDRNA2_/MRDRNA2_102013_c0_seq1:113-3604(+)